MGEIDLAGILVLEFFQAAARTAIAQTFPFGFGHFLQSLGFPKESRLRRGWLRLRGHGFLTRFAKRRRLKPLLGAAAAAAQVARRSNPQKPGGIRQAVQNHSSTIGLWSPLC